MGAFVPMIILIVGVLVSFRVSNAHKFETEAGKVMEEAAVLLNEQCGNVIEGLERVADAPSTERMLTGNDTDDLYGTYRILYTTFTELGDIADFAIYNKDGKVKLTTGDNEYSKKNISVNWGIFYELKNNPVSVAVRNARIYNGTRKLQFLRIGRTVLNSDNEVIGFVVANINDSHFAKSLGKMNLNQLGAMYITDDFDACVYSSSTVDENIFYEASKNFVGKEGEYTTPDKDYKFYYHVDEDYPLKLIYRQQLIPYNEMSKSLEIIVLLSSFLALIMCLVLSNYLSSFIYKPIGRMRAGMEAIKQGNFDVQLKVDASDELGLLTENFNEMSSKLTDNMNQLVNREKELADANIKMMQAQLNPHFIYNTLDTMKWIAKDSEISDVATLSSGLAKIMRASISSGQTVTLKNELELVESYTEIQKIRFDDKFEYISDVPDEFLDCIVPKLILQPIVENCILHGFAERAYGQVLIYAERKEDKLFIYVKDDGVGMDADTVRRLNSHEKLTSGSSIGFYNVDSIIRLHYGEGYGLSVSSDKNNGTVVKYTLPFGFDIHEDAYV